MLSKKKILSFIYFLLALLPLVSAQPFGMSGNFGQSIDRFFTVFFDLLGRQYVMLGITFLAFFTILYSIFLAATKRIKIFSGEGGANNQGKAFAIGMSLLSTLGIFFSIRDNVFEVVERIHFVMGNLGIILLGVIVFFLIYYGTGSKEQKNACLAFAASGLAMYLMAYIVEDYGWMLVGIVLIIVGLVCFIIKIFGLFKDLSGGSGGGGSTPGKSSFKGKFFNPFKLFKKLFKKGSSSKDKYCYVTANILDHSDKPVNAATIQIKNKYRKKWYTVGTSSSDSPVKFSWKVGHWKLRILYKGHIYNTNMKAYFNPGKLNLDIRLGFGPGGSGCIDGTVTDGSNPIDGIKISWNGLTTVSKKGGKFSIKVPQSKFGTYEIKASGSLLFYPFDSSKEDTPYKVTVDDKNPNTTETIEMKPLSPKKVEVTYNYGSGYTNLLIPGQVGVKVKIKSLDGSFTSPSYINRFILKRTDGEVIYREGVPGGLVINATKDEYSIDNFNTYNCKGVRYFFT